MDWARVGTRSRKGVAIMPADFFPEVNEHTTRLLCWMEASLE